LAAENGPWSNALRIEIRNAQGVVQDWPLRLVKAVEGDLSLGPRDRAQLFWQVDAAQTTALPEGEFDVTATLDTTKSAKKEGWTGRVASSPTSFRVRQEPSPLPPAIVSQKQMLFAWTAALEGRPKDAAAAVDALLLLQPRNIGALSFKGDLLAQAGDDREALDCYEKALDVFHERNPDAPEPPMFLLSKHHALLEKALRAATGPDSRANAPQDTPVKKPAAPRPPLSEADLAALVRLEIGDEVILAKIRTDGVGVKVDEGLRKRLREAGATPAVLAAIESAAAKPAAAKPMTFEDVLALLRLDIPSDAILKRLQETAGRPALTPEQMEALRKAGASAKLLEYLDDQTQEK
jgi:hypothetical protein